VFPNSIVSKGRQLKTTGGFRLGRQTIPNTKLALSIYLPYFSTGISMVVMIAGSRNFTGNGSALNRKFEIFLPNDLNL
jgi:hypothetical protein